MNYLRKGSHSAHQLTAHIVFATKLSISDFVKRVKGHSSR